MPPKVICGDHTLVVDKIKTLGDRVDDHETRLRSGVEVFHRIETSLTQAKTRFKSDMKLIRVLLILAVIASFLGGAVGPEIWKALGLIH